MLKRNAFIWYLNEEDVLCRVTEPGFFRTLQSYLYYRTSPGVVRVWIEW